MDDLNDLSWGSSMKNQQQHTPPIPPSKPQRSSGVNPAVFQPISPSAFTSTPLSKQTIASDDIFSGLVEFNTKKKPPDTSTLSLNEQRNRQQQPNLTSFSSVPLQPSTSNFTRPSSSSQNSWPSLTTLPSSTSLSTSPTPKQSFSGQSSTPVLQPSKPILQAPSTKGTNDAFVDLLGSNDFGNKFGSKGKNQSLDALKFTPHTSQGSTTAEQWNFDLLDSGLSSSKKASSANSSFDPFDMLFEAPAVARATETRISQQEGDNNPLGILAEPVLPISSPKITPQGHTKSTISAHIEQASSIDHLIAQIVDMGFTASQAKAALNTTNGKNDVTAAIEFLLQERDNEESSGLIAHKPSKGSSTRGRWRKQVESSDEDEDNEYNEESRIGYRDDQVLKQEDSDEEKPGVQNFSSLEQQTVVTGSEDKPVTGSMISDFASRLRNISASVGSTSKSTPTEQKTAAPPKPAREQPSDTQHNNVLPDKEQYREARQAAFNIKKEKLATQASELGGFLYKSASDLIKQSKDKFGKAMEDFAQPASESTSDEESNPISQKWTAVPEEPQQPRVKQQANDTPYVSPARRRPAAASPSVLGASSMVSSPAPSTSSPNNISQVRQPPRPVILADPQQLLACETFKQRGNELFKLGQFGEADSAYTKAIESLPQKHEQLILVYNNRAAARLKTGEHKTTIQDCEAILDIVGEGWLDCNQPTATGINFKEQVIKALTRQAQALENLEKYSEAITVWKKLGQVEGLRSKSLNDSIRRCEKAQGLLDGKADIKVSNQSFGFDSDSIIFDDPSRSNLNPFTADVIAAATASRSTSSSAVDPNKSAAVAKMRAQAAQAEAQDAEKLRLHDSVEAKLLLWKQGKEKNVRALLTSLDSVLWTGTGWKNVGMAEVIEVNRVKIVYMRAIGKVHPDKLKPNTTVEQRLLANGIFGTLNEAWEDFKNQNALK